MTVHAPTTRRTAAIGALICCLSALTPPAAAAQQSGATLNELRRENEALRQRVDQLEAQLDGARDTIDRLRAQVERLTAEVRSLREAVESGAAPADPPPPAQDEGPRFAEIDPEDPLAAPAAMLAAMKSTYADRLGGMPYESDLELGRYVREVKRWAREQRRELAGEVEWVIEVTAVLDGDGRSVELEYRVLDASSMLPYSDRRWVAELSRRAARRFSREPDRKLWVARGRVRGEPRVEVEREEVGFFDVPPFVGPFAEFGFDLDVEDLSAWPPEDAEGDRG